MASLTFSNIVTTGIGAQEFDWTKKFIDQYNFFLDKNEKKFQTFHICEAPGQMVKCIEYFIEKNRENLYNSKGYKWRANSLNPYNIENINTYGKGNIFSDNYVLKCTLRQFCYAMADHYFVYIYV